MELYHLTFSTLRRQPLASSEAARCAALQRLARACGPELVLFCLVDDHLHLVVARDRARAGRLASGLNRSLASRSGHRMDRAHIRAVEGRRHLETLVRYLLNQSKKHGLAVHPALWSGSCFADLMGARVLPGFDPAKLFQWLPRRDVDWVAGHVGLAAPEPVGMEQMGSFGVQQIAEASRRALCTDGVGGGAPSLAARAATVRLAAAAGVRNADIAREMTMSRRNAQRHLRRHQPSAELAVRTRLALDELVAAFGRRGGLEGSPR